MSRVPNIKIDQLSVRYRAKRKYIVALDGVSIDVTPRSFVSIVGPSGCGKTTLLKVLSGVLKASSGRVLLDGTPIEKTNLTGKIGYVFQRPLLLPWRTVLQNVLLTSEIARKNTPLRTRIDEAQKWLSVTGLAGFADQLPHELSGGMQQRVSLSRAFAFQPPILIMDEPFAALDEITRETMQEELLRLWSMTESTVVFITHSISEAVLLSERVIVMTARPGRVDEVIDVPFPRPRHESLRGNTVFIELVQYIRHKLRESQGPLGGES